MVGFCRKANEFRIEDLELSDEVLRFIGDESSTEFLNDVRNKRHLDGLRFQLYYYYRGKYDYLGDKKANDLAWELSSADADGITKKLMKLGFLREELDGYEETPEGYFLFVYWQYLPDALKRYCDKIFYKGRILSGGEEVTNVEYETYVYSEFHLKQVLRILRNLLSARQFAILEMDIMTEGRTDFSSEQRSILNITKERLSAFSNEQVESCIKAVSNS